MSSSSTSSSSSFLAAPSTTKSSQSLSPIQHLITIKLNRDNYLLWKAQITPYFKGQHLFGFLDGTQPAPPKFLPLTSDVSLQPILNPEFTTWHSQDQMILFALISTISETILAYVVKCATSHDVWTTLECMFIAQSHARSMSIHYQLATFRKGDSSISDYFHRFTHLIDTLAAIDQPLPLMNLSPFFLPVSGLTMTLLSPPFKPKLTRLHLKIFMVICSLMNFDFLIINLRLIYQPPLPILFTRALPLVVVAHPISPHIFVDAVALILQEVGGVVDLTTPLLQIALSAKCVTSLGMWPCNVITGLITHINLIILLRCRPY
jgi:hypothetical protein